MQILESFGFAVHAQAGSHVKLRRFDLRGQKQTLTVPSHKELDTGTLRAIFRQASQYIAEEGLRAHFYAEWASSRPAFLPISLPEIIRASADRLSSEALIANSPQR
ncbi:MAG: type II toxin-antitoxin system HicA family toxin [Anaerolineae bacterium]